MDKELIKQAYLEGYKAGLEKIGQEVQAGSPGQTHTALPYGIHGARKPLPFYPYRPGFWQRLKFAGKNLNNLFRQVAINTFDQARDPIGYNRRRMLIMQRLWNQGKQNLKAGVNRLNDPETLDLMGQQMLHDQFYPY